MGKKLWAAKVNIGGGLCTEEPTHMVYSGEMGSYWDDEGDWDVRGPGLERHDGWACFASKNKREVEIFIQGAQTFITVCLARYVDE
jgi:hypothetical protein